ncbi:MAG: Hsp20/alpha crystallin family protein [Phenylobacterium sp.]
MKDLQKRDFSSLAGLKQMNSLLGQMDSILDNFFGDFGLSRFNQLNSNRLIPPLDVIEKKDEIMYVLDVPGFNKENLDISINNDFLQIKGTRSFSVSKEEISNYSGEISYGSFERKILLPFIVQDIDAIIAKFDNGVLTITIPKNIKEVANSARIQIK